MFLRFFHLVVLLFLPVVALSACETLGVAPDQKSSKSDIEVVNTSALTEPKTSQSVQSENTLTSQDLKRMTSTFSGGSVEVYDLDGDGNIPKPLLSVESDYIGIPMATDPRVIVYPLDGDAGSFPVPLGTPQWNRAGYIPPVSGSSTSSVVAMTAAPQTVWEDETLDNKEGVLSPRVGQNASSVYFRYGSAKLDNANRMAMAEVAEIAKFAPVDRVSVEGHASKKTQSTDPIKSKILNLKESMNRVQAVSQKLMEEGVPAEKIKTTAWGDTKPSGMGAEQDRRVDIVTGAGAQQ